MSWLFRKGFDATLTLGHTKGVDIIVSKDNRIFKVEVKTTFGQPKVETLFGGKFYSWRMNKKHETIKDPNLIYCFISMESEQEKPKMFFVKSEQVAEYCKSQHEKWLSSPHKRKVNDGDMRTYRIRVDEIDKGYNFSIFD